MESSQTSNEEQVTKTETVITTTLADIKNLHEQVIALETKLDNTSDLLEETQQQLEGAKKALHKSNRKYERDEEEIRTNTLILDGVNERDNKRPKLVIKDLLKDLSIKNKATNIKTTYRLGPLKNGVARPIY